MGEYAQVLCKSKRKYGEKPIWVVGSAIRGTGQSCDRLLGGEVILVSVVHYP
jgi:hypothetical protein